MRHERSESAREQRIALYIKAIDDNDTGGGGGGGGGVKTRPPLPAGRQQQSEILHLLSENLELVRMVI